MKIAYIASGLSNTFVVNEIEAHHQAGWEILPIVSCKPHSKEKMSELIWSWCERGVFRPSAFRQICGIGKEAIRHPVRFVRSVGFVLKQFVLNAKEGLKAAYELPAACYFAKYCRNFGAEHIHVHFASRSLSLGIILSILVNHPISCTVHAFDIFTRSKGALRMRLLYCKFIVAISNYNVEYLQNLCGEDVAEICHVIHCGIDLDRFRSISRNQIPGRILCVANLVEKKGYPDAIAACAKLRDENIAFLFEIVGAGPKQTELTNLINGLGLQKHVKLLGSKPNDRLLDLFGKASLFLMPCVTANNGDKDGIPVAMMEAMACKVPVVSTWISGIPELVENGVNGMLVKEKDADALADSIKNLLSDTGKLRKYGEAARQKVFVEFNIVENAKQLRKLFEASSES